jgi:hypothetical protein
MDFLHRIASGFMSVLLPVVWLATAIHPAYADSGGYWLASGRRQPHGAVWPGMPQAAPPLYAPPGFVDRSPPMSQRPFAQPFIDRAPPLAERPLAPIGGGTPTVLDPAPFVWCQGHEGWAIPPSSGCIAR